MIQFSPNSIQVRARRNSSKRFDLDNNKIIYTLHEDDITVRVSSFLIHSAELAKFYLLYNSNRKTLDNKYYQRPDLLSFDEYGTEQLDWIIMMVNDVFCYEEFTFYSVYVPDKNAIATLLDFQLPDKLREVEVK